MDATVTVLIGTTKGAFLLRSDEGRREWNLTGPLCDGWPINHVIEDPATGMLWAAGGGDWHGAGIWRSSDGGSTWDLSKLSRGEFDRWAENDPDMARMFGWTRPDTPFDGDVTAVWSLAHGHGVLYAGCKPGRLYRSRDDGKSWESVAGFNEHPTREEWNPGAAGLVLHTIVFDPDDPAKLWLGISAAGVFASEDGGKTFERRNRLANAGTRSYPEHPAAPHGGETGLCVHNMVRATGGGDRLFQQNHHGVFKSLDGARSWHDVTANLPSTFGFPIAVHPHDPQTIWVLPLNGDDKGRYPPEASAAVWRSRDGGESWQDQRDGLPAQNCFFTVLRQAMATDRRTRAGVYFGTNSGSVFASTDEGTTWSEIARHLPAVLSVECWIALAENSVSTGKTVDLGQSGKAATPYS